VVGRLALCDVNALPLSPTAERRCAEECRALEAAPFSDREAHENRGKSERKPEAWARGGMTPAAHSGSEVLHELIARLGPLCT
jgi:hypothetical protein